MDAQYMVNNKIDKLLLREYINICKCTKLDDIICIINTIDEYEAQNKYQNNKKIGTANNVMWDKVVVIGDIAKRYKPNHKKILSDIYRQYHKSKNRSIGSRIIQSGSGSVFRAAMKNITDMDQQISEQIDVLTQYIQTQKSDVNPLDTNPAYAKHSDVKHPDVVVIPPKLIK